MKVMPDIFPTDLDAPSANSFSLPSGLIGFEQYKEAELLYQTDRLPFLWLKLIGPVDFLHFVVIEPGGLITGYEPELFEDHALTLGLNNPAEAMILNIVTLQRQNPLEATVNLIGPIVINRRTRVGRQLVISNYSRYSAHHSLLENSQRAGRVTSH